MRPVGLAILITCAGSFGCDHQKLDAIVGGAGAPIDGGATADDAAAPDASRCATAPEAPECGATTWPNQHSRANSDPWLSAHHDALRELHPRVLVVNFINGMSASELRAAAERLIEALGEGSRYHGYGDRSAPVFLRHEIVDVIDLADETPPADWPNLSSTRVPVDDAGVFDVAALFEKEFAELLGIPDPAAPDEVLDLCGLFRGGHINDLWLAVADAGPRHPPSMLECKARYDAAGERIPGEFVSTAENANFCEIAAACGVTVRIAHLNPMRGLGCDLDVRAWALRGSTRAVGYLHDNARAFFNLDFDERFGASFSRLDEICVPDVECVRYPQPTVAEGDVPGGGQWRIDPYEPGCGGPEYPPNARFTWDWDSLEAVQTRCEHYGLRDGPDGADAYEIYTRDSVADGTARWGGDCGGGWQMYLRQNIPGLDNPALDANDGAMKNWWVFNYY